MPLASARARSAPLSCVQQLGARSVIPAKRGKKTSRIHGIRAEMRDQPSVRSPAAHQADACSRSVGKLGFRGCGRGGLVTVPLCRDFGPFFLKFCSYFPYNAKLYMNGHEYAKRQLESKRIEY